MRSNIYSRLTLKALALAAIIFAVARGRESNEKSAGFDEYNWTSMGTYANLIFADVSKSDAEKALRIAKQQLEEIAAALSVFSPDSDISRLNNGETVALSGHAAAVLAHSRNAYERSGGAFNPAIAPLVELWGFYRGGKRISPAAAAFPPAPAAIADALKRCVFDVEIESVIEASPAADAAPAAPAKLIARLPDGARLDFGGIAKGYAVDAAYEAIRAAGVTNFLMNLGGNMRASGKAWTVAVRDPAQPLDAPPLRRVSLPDGMAVATSGGYEQFRERDGVRYCHIIDPRTGQPVQGVEQVTVIARAAGEADAFSTACFVLWNESPAKSLPAGAYALIVAKKSDGTLSIAKKIGDGE
jgi:Membrane-associated lipoprotein involved in thiamine biosynthesis